MTTRLATVIGLLFLLAAVGVNITARRISPYQAADGIRFLPDRILVELLSFDHRGLAADLTFIPVVLHSGSMAHKEKHLRFDGEWSYGMVDLATDLDPRYYSAYLFAGMGLAHSIEDIARGRALLEKGMAVFPESWELPFWIGYAQHMLLRDFKLASHYFWLAANRPNAPKSFLAMLLSASTQGGFYERAIAALEMMIAAESNPKIVQVYEMRIARQKNLLALDRAARAFTAGGRRLDHLEQLVETGLISEIPADPMGKEYRWNREKDMVETVNN